MTTSRMELDLSQTRWPIIAVAATLLLAVLAILGHTYTPDGKTILTWDEWQILKAQRAYEQELGQLQQAADTLAALLNAPPDPVRAQLEAGRIQRLAGEGQPSLAYAREKLALAAQAVSYWAVGALDQASTQAALDQALAVLSPQPTPTPANE